MYMNPEWNASYLRQPAMPTFIPGGYARSGARRGGQSFVPSGYGEAPADSGDSGSGSDAVSTVGRAVGGAAGASGAGGTSVSAGDIYGIGAGLTAIGGVASAWIGLKTVREQSVAGEKSQRLQAKQQRESNILTQNMMTVSLLQQQEAAKSREKLTKTLVTGLGLVAVLAVLGFVAIQALKVPSA